MVRIVVVSCAAGTVLMVALVAMASVTGGVCFVQARALEPSELLIGEWEVSLRVLPRGSDDDDARGGRQDRSRNRINRIRSGSIDRVAEDSTRSAGLDVLFPPATIRRAFRGGDGVGGGGTVASDMDPDGRFRLWGWKTMPVATTRRPKREAHECQLAVFSNRTFALWPVVAKAATAATLGQEGINDGGSSSAPHYWRTQQRLPIRGEWTVLSNPYCVTDRYYDDLHLTSYPRVQTRSVVIREQQQPKDRKRTTTTRKENAAAAELVISTEPVQRIQLELHGQLFGHYTAGGIVRRIVGEDRYYRGRIANGVVLLCRQDPRLPHQQALVVTRSSCSCSRARTAAPWPFRRYPQRKVVVATFTAKRRVPPFPKLIQAIDEDHLRGFELYNARSGKEFLTKLLRW
jgi:hypothetical protein